MEGDSYEPQEYTIKRTGTGRHYRSKSRHIETYKATFSTIDKPRSAVWGKGDLIKFNSCFHYSWLYDEKWQSWVMEPEEYFKFLKKNCKLSNIVPMYAHHEYAIILTRYKWTKQKSFKVYTDYGSIIMMLSGQRAGHIRRYYSVTPWEWIAVFPYKNSIHRDLPKVIPLIEDSLDDDLQVFLKNITEKFT